MSYVEKRIAELRNDGIYVAQKVDPEVISRILNMEEHEYYTLETAVIESYMGLLSQQIYYIQQEINTAEAREFELGNKFKINAIPLVIDSKIRSVEERWLYASLLSDELEKMYYEWQEAIIDAKLKKNLDQPIIEKLLTLKKIYDERRLEGVNKAVHNAADRWFNGKLNE